MTMILARKITQAMLTLGIAGLTFYTVEAAAFSCRTGFCAIQYKDVAYTGFCITEEGLCYCLIEIGGMEVPALTDQCVDS